jgi:16S rRNA processing protein RimM
MQVIVGRIGRPHGVRGELAVEPRTDEPVRRFAPGARLRTDSPATEPLTVRAARRAGERLLVCFAEVVDRGAAEALRGRVLFADVDADERPAEPEEFYDHQLVGLQAFTAERRVGVVTDIAHLPAQDVLSVRRDDGAERLVPFVTDLVPEVDLAAGRLVINDRPGLLDDEP